MSVSLPAALAVLAVAFVPAVASAQSAGARPSDADPSVTTGIFLGAHLDGATLVVNGDSATGPGASITLGYGLTPRFAVLAALSEARLSGVAGERLALNHVDVAGRWHVGGGRRRLVPHVDQGVTSRATRPAPGDVRARRTAIGVGVGLNYYVTPTLSAGGTLKYGLGRIGGSDCPVSGTGSSTCAASTRAQVGLSWFPRRGDRTAQPPVTGG